MSAKNNYTSPFRLFGSITLLLSIVGAALFYLWLSYNPIVCWLTSVNIVTFTVYGYDKVMARSGGLRVPENILHGLALIGGFAGGLCGMFVFHHKTSKGSFQLIFWAIIVLWIMAIVSWLIMR